MLSLTLESVDGSNFFDEDKIVANLAALLGVPKEKIKIAKIVAEGKISDKHLFLSVFELLILHIRSTIAAVPQSSTYFVITVTSIKRLERYSKNFQYRPPNVLPNTAPPFFPLFLFKFCKLKKNNTGPPNLVYCGFYCS